MYVNVILKIFDQLLYIFNIDIKINLLLLIKKFLKIFIQHINFILNLTLIFTHKTNFYYY